MNNILSLISWDKVGEIISGIGAAAIGRVFFGPAGVIFGIVGYGVFFLME